MAIVYRKKSYNNKTHSSHSWRSLPYSIEPDDVKKLLKRRYSPRDKCMIFILLRTGIRISELLNLKLQNIRLKSRIILINRSAKTGVGRIAYISDDVYRILKNWLKMHNSGGKFLLYSRGRKNMSYGTARLIFIKYLKRAGLLKKKIYSSLPETHICKRITLCWYAFRISANINGSQ